MKNPYRSWVQALVRHQARGAALPLGGITPPRRPRTTARAPKVLLFSPHPDDECIVGGLALRLLREQRMNVINIAVTLGSNVARRSERARELDAACRYLGFELELAGGQGLDSVNAETREKDPAGWQQKVECIAALLQRHQPRVILMPHAGDAHPTHRGTHRLVLDALNLEAGRPRPAEWAKRRDGAPSPDEQQSLEAGRPRPVGQPPLLIVETEFWSPMDQPNVMVELSPRDLSDLVAALSCHAGEVQRNPYHLRLPAWMQDNVRRGAERVIAPGAAAPGCHFAILYRFNRLHQNGLEAWPNTPRLVSNAEVCLAALWDNSAVSG